MKKEGGMGQLYGRPTAGGPGRSATRKLTHLRGPAKTWHAAMRRIAYQEDKSGSLQRGLVFVTTTKALARILAALRVAVRSRSNPGRVCRACRRRGGPDDQAGRGLRPKPRRHELALAYWNDS